MKKDNKQTLKGYDMEQKCEDCKFYKCAEVDCGYCHYNPPIVTEKKDEKDRWPFVNSTDFCSKYEKRQETKNKQPKRPS